MIMLKYLIIILIIIIILIFIFRNRIGEYNKIKAISVLNNGIINFEELPNGKTKIKGIINNLKPGKHGFHIHKSGNTTKGCDSMCDHYNPFNKNHGDINVKERHVGDLGNITADENGIAKINLEDDLIKLRGPYSVIGRGLIVHEDPDDLGLTNHPLSKTTGNSGKRIDCGIIAIN